MTIPFLSVRPRAVKVKVIPKFPLNVVSGVGVTVNMSAGNIVPNLDYSKFAQIGGVAPATSWVVFWDTITKQFSLYQGSAYTGEAPQDGTTYGRKNAGWANVLNLADGGTITGNVTFNGTATFTNVTTVPTPTLAAQAANKGYVDSAVGNVAGNALPLMNGVAAAGVSASYSRQDHVHPTDTTRAPLASPALTGTPTAPTAAPGTNTTQLATTAFVSVSFAPLASPAFTGTPTAPTAALNTNTTQVATTAFVIGQASSTTPNMDGTAAVGTGTTFARADHTHPTDTTRAPLASPTFTGTPAAPTAAPGTNTTQLATTAFVATSFAPLASPALTGTPTAPTPAANDNSTKIATTAFVDGQAATVAPLMDGTAAVGTSLLYARQDHVHPTDTSRMATAGGQTITGGFNLTPFNAGTISTGTFTPAPLSGNYQYYTNNGAHTLAAPASDCAMDIMITNGASAGAITFSGFTVGANVGDSLTTTSTNKFIISIRRINAVATYTIKALQ